MSGRRCPGCARPLGARAEWCEPCRARLPASLQDQLLTAQRDLARVTARVQTWLRTHPRVTERELELIRLAASGLTDREIAEHLALALVTVRDYWKDLLRRWECRGRVQAVAMAVRLGYLRIEVAR